MASECFGKCNNGTDEFGCLSRTERRRYLRWARRIVRAHVDACVEPPGVTFEIELDPAGTTITTQLGSVVLQIRKL